MPYASVSRIIHDDNESFSRLFHDRLPTFAALEGNLAQLTKGDHSMKSSDYPTCCPIALGFPPLRQPAPETADRGTLRFGDGCISAGFPPLRQPKPETADRGTLRFGDGCISAGFPPHC
jgi:hypothetical protein